MRFGEQRAAATWWTGLGMVVIGFAWAGYWGYQAWTAAGNNAPSPSVGECSCDIEDEWYDIPY